MFNFFNYDNESYDDEEDRLRLPNYIPRYEFGNIIPSHLSSEKKEEIKKDIVRTHIKIYNFILPPSDDVIGKNIMRALLNPKWKLRSHNGLMQELDITEEQFEEGFLNNATEILYDDEGKFFLRARYLGIHSDVIKEIFNL